MEVRRSEQLERFAEEARQASKRHDDEWYARHTADGEVVGFGTDPDEIWRGREAVLGLTAAQIDEMNENAGVKYERNSVEGYEAGDAGFIITHGQFVLVDGTSFPCRGVNFLVKDGGTWKSIVGGMSLLVSNELMTQGSPLGQTAARA